MAVALRGGGDSVASLLHREGLAYALGGNPYGPVTSDNEQAVSDAVEVLGASDKMADMAAVLYGDGAAAALGWAPAGVAEHGGYRWAIARAEQRIKEAGPSAVVRATPAA